jgi:hypothetical protein
MRVPTADEHQILRDRNRLLHRRHYARAAPEDEADGGFRLSTDGGGVIPARPTAASSERACGVSPPC